MSEPAPRVPPPESDVIGEMLRGHDWWVRLLVHGHGAWTILAPWPLGRGLARMGIRATWVKRDSPFSSLAVLLAVHATFWPLAVEDPGAAHQSLGELMFAGVGLVTGLLGIATALPGPSLLQAVLKRHPRAFVDHVRPYLVALVFGSAGGLLLLLWSVADLSGMGGPIGRFICAYIVWMGALSLFAAMFFAIKNYTLGLYYLSRTNNA